jgi:hypothetical protein
MTKNRKTEEKIGHSKESPTLGISFINIFVANAFISPFQHTNNAC